MDEEDVMLKQKSKDSKILFGVAILTTAITASKPGGAIIPYTKLQVIMVKWLKLK